MLMTKLSMISVYLIVELVVGNTTVLLFILIYPIITMRINNFYNEDLVNCITLRCPHCNVMMLIIVWRLCIFYPVF